MMAPHKSPSSSSCSPPLSSLLSTSGGSYLLSANCPTLFPTRLAYSSRLPIIPGSFELVDNVLDASILDNFSSTISSSCLLFDDSCSLSFLSNFSLFLTLLNILLLETTSFTLLFFMYLSCQVNCSSSWAASISSLLGLLGSPLFLLFFNIFSADLFLLSSSNIDSALLLDSSSSISV